VEGRSKQGRIQGAQEALARGPDQQKASHRTVSIFTARSKKQLC